MGIEMILHKEGGFDFTLKKIHYKKKFQMSNFEPNGTL